MRRVEKGLSLLIGAVLASSVSTALLRDDDGAGTALPPTPTPSFSEAPFPSLTDLPSETAEPIPTDTTTNVPAPEPTDAASEAPGPSPEPTESETSSPAPAPTSSGNAELPKGGIESYPIGWLMLALAGAAMAVLRSRPRPA